MVKRTTAIDHNWRRNL